jgi:PAS domain S-box-containing protein
MMMVIHRLNRLKWLTAALAISFLLGFDYLRHFVFVAFLHSWPVYAISVAAVVVVILLFNQVMFATLDKMQQHLVQHNRSLSTLNAIAATVSQSLDLDATLNDALDQVLDFAGVDAAGIQLVEGEWLCLKVYRKLPPHLVEAVRTLRVGEGLSGRVAASGEPIVVHEAFSQDPRLSNAVVRQAGFESFACVPLSSKGKVVGVLSLAAYQRRMFSTADLELLSAIGHQIGVAIENAVLHAQVQQQASYLTTLIESSGNAIITVDLQGRILSWNRAAESIYGWTKAEAIGQVIPMVPGHLRDEATQLMDGIIQTGETVANFETQRLRKGDELIPVLVTVSPICDATGNVVRILGISTDMRDRKRLEHDLLRQQRDLAVLHERERLARALHDDVGQVLGYVNMQTQAVRELLATGQTAAADSHLARLADVAQSTHANLREHILGLKLGAVREQPFLPALEAHLQRFSRYDDVHVELNADHARGIRFAPDAATQLLCIIQEALTNTQKHAHAQHVRVSCAVDSDQACITIVDDGQGFDLAQVVRQDGRHFGLRIMRDRAEEIGGQLQVQSCPGQGTTVTVTVPIAEQEGVIR